MLALIDVLGFLFFFQQVLNSQYPNNDQSASSKYLHMRQEDAVQMLFPKPIYSYRYRCSTFYHFLYPQCTLT